MKPFSLKLMKVALGPVLLAQGLWVRYKTPLLPEPEMSHSGVFGQGQPLRLLLLGDSSAAGVGVDTFEASLLGQLLKNLCPNYQVNYQLIAKTGRTTADTLAILKQHSAPSFDVIITALGVNDVTAQIPVKMWIKQQQQLILMLQQKFSPRKIMVSGLPPMRAFPALPWPLNAYMGNWSDTFDEALIELCRQYDNVSFHSLRGYPNEAQAAVDGFHPGPVVYSLWAQYLSAEIGKLESE